MLPQQVRFDLKISSSAEFFLPLLLLIGFLCTRVNAAEVPASVEPSETLYDLALGNQKVILAGAGFVLVLVIGALAFNWLSQFLRRLDYFEFLAYQTARASIDRPQPPTPPPPRLPLSHGKILWIAAIIIFVIALTLSLLLWQSDAKVVDETKGLPLPKPICNHTSSKAAVVFIHGWKGNDTTWAQFPSLACDDNRLADAEVYLFNYPTFLSYRNSSVGGLAKWLVQDFFSAVLVPKYTEIHIIAHSMGGLIARQIYLLESFSNKATSAAPAIRSLITIASPYEGAEIARLANALGISRKLVADMDPRSAFLSNLAGEWSFVRPKPVTHCFTSPQDDIVPQWSAKGQCECTFDYPQWGHIEMVKPIDSNDARYRNPMRALESVLGVDISAARAQGHSFCLG